MGIIDAGILGVVRGKVGNVVGQTWKGINYLRIWVKPTDARSPAQLVYRNRMAFLTPIARVNLQSSIHLGFMKEVEGKPLSEYNLFFSHNMQIVDIANNMDKMVISEGVVGTPTMFSAIYNTISHQLTLSWSTQVEQGALSTDTIKIFYKRPSMDYMSDLTIARTVRGDASKQISNFDDRWESDCTFYLFALNSDQEASNTSGVFGVPVVP